nr:hypothetical protein [uncultured Allomuricauda sp.]
MALGILFCFAVLWYLVLKRYINPDNYFKNRLESVSFTHLNINCYKGGMRLSAELENNFRSVPSGKIQYSINNGYELYIDEHGFEIDSNNTFRLLQLKDGSSMVLGTVVDKTFLDYSQSYLYKIKLPENYIGSHEYARGMFPYYVPIKFTMMSSGGNKYSHEERTMVISPQGDTLRLYQNYGHMDSGEKTGIYKH